MYEKSGVILIIVFGVMLTLAFKTYKASNHWELNYSIKIPRKEDMVNGNKNSKIHPSLLTE